MTQIIRAPIRIEAKCLSRGINISDAINIDKNIGIPPPRGVGTVWITFGWLLDFGSSMILILFASLITIGVSKYETNAAKDSGIKSNSIILFMLE